MFTSTRRHVPTGAQKTFTWEDDIRVSLSGDSQEMWEDVRVVKTGWRKTEPQKIIIGQEAICLDGLGRVTSCNDEESTVLVHVGGSHKCWPYRDVKLIDPRGEYTCSQSP